MGIAPKISDAKVITLCVMQALLGFESSSASYATPAMSCDLGSLRSTPEPGRRIGCLSHLDREQLAAFVTAPLGSYL